MRKVFTSSRIGSGQHYDRGFTVFWDNNMAAVTLYENTFYIIPLVILAF